MKNKNAPVNNPISFPDSTNLILDECRLALNQVDPVAVEKFIEAVLSAEKIFFVGVGRVMLALQAMAKRFNHLGLDTYCVGQITEPAITERDLLIIGSGSGESLIPIAVAKKAKSFGARTAHVGSNPESSLKPITDIFVRIPVCTKLNRPGEINSQQLMTSLFEQCLLIFGDAVAGMIFQRKHLDVKTLWRSHANLE